MRERTIASHFARAALGGARRHGYDYSGLLQQLGISPELLDEPRARIAPEPVSYTHLTLPTKA